MTEQVKISRSAVASLVLGLLYNLPLIPAVLAVIFGFVARRQIHRSEGRYLGKGLATAGIIVGVIQGMYWVFSLFSGSSYLVAQHDTAIITRFGAIQKTVTLPGRHFKMPFVDKAIIFPNKVFEWQSTDYACVTADGHRVTVRAKLRWRICDPVRYFQTVGSGSADERLAANKLADIFYGGIKIKANGYPVNEFVSSVRNLSLQKNLHMLLNAKLNTFGICLDSSREEPYEIIETSLK